MTQEDMLAIVHRARPDDHFERAIIEQALALTAQARSWNDRPHWFMPSDSCVALEWTIQDATEGAFKPRVFFSPRIEDVAIESTCSCGTAQCTHAAALVLRVQRYFEWPRAVDPVERWLSELDDDSTGLSESRKSRAIGVAFLLRAERPTSRLGPLLAAPVSLLGDGRSGRVRLGRVVATDEGTLEHFELVSRLRLAPRRGRAEGRVWHQLKGNRGQALLEALLATRACYFDSLERPLQLGPARVPEWSWELEGNGSQVLRWMLSAAAVPRTFHVEDAWYVDGEDGAIGKVAAPVTLLAAIERMPAIPHATARALRQTWPPHERLRGIPAPLEIAEPESRAATMRPVLLLAAARCKAHALPEATMENPGGLLYLLPFADYGGVRVALGERRYVATLTQREESKVYSIRRDISAEDRARALIDASDLRPIRSVAEAAIPLLEDAIPAGALGDRHHLHTSQLGEFQHALHALVRHGFALERDPALPLSIIVWPAPMLASFDEEDDGCWFDMRVGIEVDGEYINLLPLIARALKEHDLELSKHASGEEPKWLVEAAGGRWIELPMARVREAIAPILGWIDIDAKDGPESIRVSRVQAAVIAARLPQRRGSDLPELRDVVRHLAEAIDAPLPDTPLGFDGILRPYQREGLRWLTALKAHRLGGVLADDMGLGKTIQVLAHLQAEKEAGRLQQPALVIAPKSLIFNWVEEAARFTPALRVLVLHGAQRHGRFDDIPAVDLVITTYALISLDIELLRERTFSLLIVDESQWVKNPDTQAARALADVRGDSRLALTGTPLENHLGELWAQFNITLPGYLGERRRFNRHFRTPIEKHADVYKAAVLQQRIAPFMLRRTKDRVATELPPKTETTLYVEMEAPQRALYEALRAAQHSIVREAIAAQGIERSGIVVLSALLKLRQVCCDPRLIKAAGPVDRVESAKLEALAERAESLIAEGRILLIFSQFTQMLELIAQRMNQCRLPYVMLTGQTVDRGQVVKRFQSGEVPVLLASLKAGGVGLNLTAADTVIHYDPWWNPAAENQATDRAYRMGQDKPVFVYRLMCRNTIEEKIESLKQRKADLVCGILDVPVEQRVAFEHEHVHYLLGPD